MLVVAVGLHLSACVTEFNNPVELNGGSSEVNYTRATQPSAVTVTMNPPGTDDIVSGGAGSVPSDATVEVFADSGMTLPLGSATAGQDGSFGPIAIGDNQATGDQIYIVVTPVEGGARPPISFGNDSTPPAFITAGSFTLTSNAPGTADTIGCAAGCAEPGALLRIYDDALMTTLLFSATVAGDGSIATFAIGDNGASSDNIYVVVEDTAGNRSNQITLANDVTPPATPTAGLMVQQNFPGTQDQVFGNVGSVEALATVKVYKESGLATLLGTGTAAANGSVTLFDIGDNQATSDLVYVVAVDAAGNVSGALSTANDVTPPAAPDVLEMTVGQNAPGNADTLSGSAGAVEGGAMVRVFLESSLTTLVSFWTSDLDGSFPAFGIGDNFTGDTIYIVARDTYGNVSSTVTMTNDVTAPSAPDAGKLTVTMNGPSTNDTISGTAGAAEAGTDVRVYKESGLSTSLGNATAGADGSFAAFSIGDNQATSDLVYVVAVDAAGNVSTTTSMTNDVTAPSAPDAGKLTIAMNDPGTNDMISGTAGAAEAGTDVRVYKESGLSTSLGNATAGADGSFAAFSIGDNQATSDLVYVVAVDAAGNISSATSLTNDVTAPTFSGIERLVPVSDSEVLLGWYPATDAGTQDYDISYEVCQNTTSGACTSAFTANYSLGVERFTSNVTGLASGTTYYFTVRAKDQAGNATISAERRRTDRTDLVKLTGGWGHSCGLFSDGSAKCWGTGFNGLLGNGSSSDSLTPVQVTGLGSGVADIDTLMSHTCAVKSADGSVWCWGYNSDGQLGDSTTTPRNSPVQVCTDASCLSTLSNMSTAQAGSSHTCAVTQTGGEVYCWGKNTLGQLGDGTTTASPTPVHVCAPGETAPCATYLSDIVELAAGTDHNCARSSTGNLFCWGNGGSGQIGDGGGTDRSVPVQVAGTWISVAAGQKSTCGVLNDGTAYCWGDNFNGQVGDGTSFNTRTTPQAVCSIGGASPCLTYLTGQTSVVAQHEAYCALAGNGEVTCWGLASEGQLGASAAAPYRSTTPLLVTGVTGVTALHTGPAMACATLAGGAIACWGDNRSGKAGFGDTASNWEPTYIRTAVADVAVGNAHSCLLDSGTDQVFCSGVNSTQQIGNHTGWRGGVMHEVIQGITPAALEAGYEHSCALDSSGTAQCWGKNSQGELGIGSSGPSESVPTAVAHPLLEPAKQISGGYTSSCGVFGAVSLSAWCWGSNSEGQVGDTGAGPFDAPVAVMGLPAEDVSKVVVSTSYSFACALLASGTVYCWGRGTEGALGDGTATNSTTAVQVCAEGETAPCGSFLTGATDIEAGTLHACAVVGGGVKCWGSSGNGQIGDKTFGMRTTPVSVCAPDTGFPCTTYLSGITKLAAGNYHTCALDSTGSVYCWGARANGALGAPVSTADPARVVGIGRAASIRAAKSKTCVVMSNTDLHCWGEDEDGAFGNKVSSYFMSPVKLLADP